MNIVQVQVICTTICIRVEQTNQKPTPSANINCMVFKLSQVILRVYFYIGAFVQSYDDNL
jgi:hypothetical protein